MQLLKDRIRKDGKVKEGNVLKVDSFLNHQMDIRPVPGDRKGVHAAALRVNRDQQDPDDRGFRYRHCLYRSGGV